MPPTIHPYAKALKWCRDAPGKSFVLLGNGFSMAYDRNAFGYAALADHAVDEAHLPKGAQSLMMALGTKDFEAAMRALRSTIATLTALDAKAHRKTIRFLEEMVDEIREALVHSVAGLHPERPQDIDDRRYLSVRQFLDGFDCIYSANYDLLLYWALMQELSDGSQSYPSRSHDDGFRDSGIDGEDTVLWNIYNPFGQSVHYLHGALHLYLGLDGLRKLTWIRTGVALIDQVREQLDIERYPLYVAEADSATKLDRINRSAYLSKALRSLTSIGGSLVVYGHSLDSNDNHILEAIIRSGVKAGSVLDLRRPDDDRQPGDHRSCEGSAERERLTITKAPVGDPVLSGRVSSPVGAGVARRRPGPAMAQRVYASSGHQCRAGVSPSSPECAVPATAALSDILRRMSR